MESRYITSRNCEADRSYDCCSPVEVSRPIPDTSPRRVRQRKAPIGHAVVPRTTCKGVATRGVFKGSLLHRQERRGLFSDHLYRSDCLPGPDTDQSLQPKLNPYAHISLTGRTAPSWPARDDHSESGGQASSTRSGSARPAASIQGSDTGRSPGRAPVQHHTSTEAVASRL